MSHFTVLVFGNDPEKQLAPYHEFECTGQDDEYVVDVDLTADAKAAYEKYFLTVPREEKPQTFFEYVQDYYGYKVIEDLAERTEDHKFGYVFNDLLNTQIKVIQRTNPHAKWDWYELGGRWNNYFKLKNGSRANAAMKCDIDIEGMRYEAMAKAEKEYDAYAAAVAGLEPGKSFAEFRKLYPDTDKAREFYHAQPAKIALRKLDLYPFDDPFETFGTNKDAYVESKMNSAISTFAVIGDGLWFERGDMGWFGMVADEKDEDTWAADFNKVLDELPAETLLSVYDCHI
jgi:hypothetical protein